MIIGNSLITNSNQRTRLYIDGNAPILREKDILTDTTATSPCKLIYLAVQLMYLRGEIETMRKSYFELINDLIKAAPSTMSYIDDINNEILTGSLYKALKAAKRLIIYEQELMGNAESGSDGLPAGSKTDC
ncbi:Flagellum biosynthesis repressor protein FlbT [hydrothermal vent metagenome]|uniref:Flagellum biosynthesis repressor protein FlbT n=1 Tax=hydrothermal vent metagenome TaxID=652676 RepID=A0A3B0U5N8_9ZZZZ